MSKPEDTPDFSPEFVAGPSAKSDSAAVSVSSVSNFDAVAAALNRAKAVARRGRNPSAIAASRRRRWTVDQRSAAGSDARDPQLLTGSVEHLVRDRGWQTPLAVGGVMGRWAAVVGADIAAHCQPESFNEQVLMVRADSTAWATQVRLLVPTLLARMAVEVGEGVVTTIVIQGPNRPSWRRGPRVAPGSKGPGDTYG